MSTVPTPQSETVWFPWTRRFLRHLGRESSYVLEIIGLAVQNIGLMIRFLVTGKLSGRHFAQQAAFVGLGTLGIALILTTFSGMVIALQIAQEMVRQGAGNYVGALVSMAILREMAPIMTGFAVISLAGSAYAAEISTMQITSQISALQVLHVHPVRYLILPRVLACTSMVPLMTVVTSFTGIMGGMAISYLLADISPDVYLESVWYQTQAKDIWAALLKAGTFGFLIAILSTTIGYHTHGGSREVGLATTRAVVWSFVAMAIFDYLLTYFIYGAS